MFWRSRGRPGAREVRGKEEELFKDGSKTRLRVRRSANHRVDCKMILQNETTILAERMRTVG